MNRKRKRTLIRILSAFTLLIVIALLPLGSLFDAPTATRVSFALYLIPYLIVGYDVLLKAGRNIGHGQVFDENFLMSVATLGAFALVLFPDAQQHFAEGTAVMLFYQVGELFQSYAVGKSRKSISEMMDIAPDYANVERDGQLVQVDPDEVAVGDEIVIKPGERVPIDGVVTDGVSELDTAALTGEAVPRSVHPDDEIFSGCVNMSGRLIVRTTKPFATSTVSRILELVENAAEKKAHTENIITRFARYYTPAVVLAAVLLSAMPPLLLGLSWSDWVQRGLIFLVVSCPCAFVIAVPLSFFGGIGGASRAGILVKGSNYLEMLSKADTVVFDKTGTLTDGSFNVVAVHPEKGVDPDRLLSYAAHAEAFSDHPIALSLKAAYSGPLDEQRISDVREQSGHGVQSKVDEHLVVVGNDRLMDENDISCHACDLVGTILHVALDGAYIGHIVIADVPKTDAAEAIEALHAAGIGRTVMLTGDRSDVASAVAAELGIDEVHAQLLPQDKVALLEQLLAAEDARKTLAFVGDGINDAPVLARADVGIAMGGMGSDAAIEAADIVLMDDRPTDIARAVRISRKTMSIVYQNIAFALGVKFLVLLLAVIGLANMWMAVFADVGVTCLAILNAMRALRVRG